MAYIDPTTVRLSEHFLLSDFPEVWLDIPGKPGYQVSTLGMVRRAGKGRNANVYYLLYPGLSRSGYRRVTLRGQGRRTYCKVSTLVALAFLGPRPVGAEVRHLDGNSTNDRRSNLAYGTHTENMRDKIAHNTQPRGEKSHLAKTTKEAVRAIRRLVSLGRPKDVIARRYGLSVRTINDISTRRTWRDVA